MKKNPKKETKSITINISSLVENLVIVTTNENEASETIKQKVTEALKNVVKIAQEC